MEKAKTGTFDEKAYQREYHNSMKTKLLSFNPRNPRDMEIWEHIQGKKNVTEYIKGLIVADMGQG